jgi:hypothetical protein
MPVQKHVLRSDLLYRVIDGCSGDSEGYPLATEAMDGVLGDTTSDLDVHAVDIAVGGPLLPNLVMFHTAKCSSVSE